MITRNGSLWFGKHLIAGKDITGADSMIRIDGTRSPSPDFSNLDYELIVGSGSTLPALSDYKLESKFNNNVLTPSPSTIEVNTTANGNVIFTQSFTNVSSSNVTVSEIGILADFHSYDDYMLSREVLSQPRTIAPNETVTFSYEVALN